MEIINNISKTMKDDLMVEIKPESKISIAESCFISYVFQEKKMKVEKPSRKKYELYQQLCELKELLEK